MIDMEHMRMRWKAYYLDLERRWIIESEQWGRWTVARVVGCLPGDDSGERTAKEICHAHNAALDADKRLRDLLSQWRETAALYSTHPDMAEAASGYRECIRELEAVMSGDLRPIEPIARVDT